MPKTLVALTRFFTLIVLLLTIGVSANAQQPAAAQNQGTLTTQTPNAQPAIEEWRDDFDGDRLDETKWETYTFEGGGGGKIEVKGKQLRMRGAGGSRSGVRSKQTFRADRFLVEATLAKVGMRSPQPGEEAFPQDSPS